MANIIEIDELSAPGPDLYSALTRSQLKRQGEPGEGIFIAESPKVIGYALSAGYEPVSLLMERKHIDGKARDIVQRCGAVPVYTGDRETLAALTGYELTRGVLCAMRRKPLPSMETVCGGAGRVAVLERIVDPTNVGAIFRSAAALGVDAVLVTPSCCDPLSRRAVRVSMGTIFQIPWTVTGGALSRWPEDGMPALRQMGFKTAAMALGHDAVCIDDAELKAEKRLALIFGTEGEGLSPQIVKAADYKVCIPMAHGVDSLNVAAASAVAFWQLCRG